MARLYISELTIANFRSHARARLDCDGRPVALFGPNGAGKTNILEAVSMLSPGRGLRRATMADMARRPAAPGWKVRAGLQTPDLAHELETWSENGAARQVRIDGKAAAQVALGRLLRVLWLVPVMDRLWVEGADGRRRFLDRVTLSFEPGHAQTVLDYDKAMRERNRLIREEVRDGRWFDALEAQMARAGAAIVANRAAALDHLRASQDAANPHFPAAALALSHPDDTLPDTEADLRTAFADSRPRDMAAGRALTGPHRTDLEATYAAKDIPARDCSTGEQKALLISLVLANARALAALTGAPPLLLLDEVAAHLDATRRAALFDEIVTLGVQAFMTGTGPELFEELGARAQRIEVHEGAQGSGLHPL